jgi:F-type H+-transporting ATPase subunit b
MELVLKIFDTLGITPYAVLQMALTVVLAFLLSATLIRPILATFREREHRSVGPLEEARRLVADAEEKSKTYDESRRRATSEALARKRRRMEETSRAERQGIDAVASEANRRIDALKGKIAAEKDGAARQLRSEVSRLSKEIAEKVLGRRVA